MISIISLCTVYHHITRPWSPCMHNKRASGCKNLLWCFPNQAQGLAEWCGCSRWSKSCFDSWLLFLSVAVLVIWQVMNLWLIMWLWLWKLEYSMHVQAYKSQQECCGVRFFPGHKGWFENSTSVLPNHLQYSVYEDGEIWIWIELTI